MTRDSPSLITRHLPLLRCLVGAAGIEPATLCLAAGPAFLLGLDYIFGIAAALLIVSEDSPLRATPSRRGCLLIALPGSQHTAASSIRVHFPVCAPDLKADALSPELRAQEFSIAAVKGRIVENFPGLPGRLNRRHVRSRLKVVNLRRWRFLVLIAGMRPGRLPLFRHILTAGI